MPFILCLVRSCSSKSCYSLQDGAGGQSYVDATSSSIGTAAFGNIGTGTYRYECSTRSTRTRTVASSRNMILESCLDDGTRRYAYPV